MSVWRYPLNWDQYTNESDSHCFDVALGVLDRDAIRHATMVEGNFDDMLDAIRKSSRSSIKGY